MDGKCDEVAVFISERPIMMMICSHRRCRDFTESMMTTVNFWWFSVIDMVRKVSYQTNHNGSDVVNE